MLFKSFKLTLKSILVNMAANDELPMDMNQLNIDDVVNKIKLISKKMSF